MSKRPSLAEAIKPKPTAVTLPTPVLSKTASRLGTRMLGFHVPEPVQRQFKILAAEQGKTVQAMLQEAVNDLFHKYDKDTIA